MKKTPLHDLHQALGARMVDYAGWRMPVQYGPILEEVEAVRSAVGLFDLSHMGRVRISGKDAVAFVDNIATNYCARIPVGAIRYSLFCRENGAPIDDLLIYRGQDEVFLVVNAANTREDLDWMQAHSKGMDATIEDQTDELAMIALQGVGSELILAQVIEGFDLSSLRYYRFAQADLMGLREVRVSRTGYTGEDGFEIYLPASDAQRVWSQLMEVGTPHGLRPIGLAARDTLRLEAGMPLYGHEIDADHNPVEAGLGFGISFAEEKGDWIGRQALMRIKEKPRRTLIGLTTEGPRVPRQGYPLLRDDEQVGDIRSGSPSPTLKTNIATAYVPIGLDEVGSELEVDVRGKRQKCTVHGLPFYSRKRK